MTESVASRSNSYRWTQLVIGIVCMTMIANLQYGWTLFVGPLDNKYHWGRAGIQVALVTEIFGNDQSFFVPAPPSVATITATSIHPGQATLNATINPNDLPTVYWFQHGPTTSYGDSTPTNMLTGGINPVVVNNLVTEADHASERAIFEVIKSTFPDHFILSEEAGEIVMDVDAVPLAEVEKTWHRADSGRRVVFVP